MPFHQDDCFEKFVNLDMTATIQSLVGNTTERILTKDTNDPGGCVIYPNGLKILGGISDTYCSKNHVSGEALGVVHCRSNFKMFLIYLNFMKFSCKT